MAVTANYCLRSDVIARLTEQAVTWLADDDADGASSQTELATAVDAAIEAVARTDIDTALAPWINSVPMTQDDSSLNAALRHWAVDLAAERLASRGGNNVPDSLIDAAERAREMLGKVQSGKIKVPGITYPGEGAGTEIARRSLGMPAVANPGGGRRQFRRPWWRRGGR